MGSKGCSQISWSQRGSKKPTQKRKRLNWSLNRIFGDSEAGQQSDQRKCVKPMAPRENWEELEPGARVDGRLRSSWEARRCPDQAGFSSCHIWRFSPSHSRSPLYYLYSRCCTKQSSKYDDDKVGLPVLINWLSPARRWSKSTMQLLCFPPSPLAWLESNEIKVV